MKKKLVIIIIGLFILIPVISNWYEEFTTPDKVLAVGHSIDGEAIEFKKEIEDQEKIVKYENILKSLEFTKTEWEPSQYPDYILKVDHLVEGIATSFVYIWFNEGQGIVFRPSTPNENFARLTDLQVEILKDIVE